MNPIQRRADRVRGIALESVLHLAGAQPDRHDPHKWHTTEAILSVTGSKFMNWSRAMGGGGAIDLVMHLNNRGFMEALQWLEHHFPAGAPVQSSELCHKTPLQLPTPQVQNLWRVQGYLNNERRLPFALMEPLFASSQIYADSKANAVFVLLDQSLHPVGAELRGTTHRSWRGMVPGSQKDLGFFAVGSAQAKSVVLCESAIDAISCCALHPEYRCLSTSGARPNPRWLCSLINRGIQIYCGYDADSTGDAMAHAMVQCHPSIQRLRPRKKDWNDLLRPS